MFHVLKMLMSVPVIMVCALGGTVGLIKIIEKLKPDGDAPETSGGDGKE